MEIIATKEEDDIRVHRLKKVSVAALPSDMCFVTQLDTVISGLKHEQATYELEPFLLIPAEDIAFDLQVHGQRSTAIAVDARRVLSRLPEKAVDSVIAVVPAAVLVAQGWFIIQAQNGHPKTAWFVIVGREHSDVLFIENSVIVQWRYCNPENCIETATELIDRQDLPEGSERNLIPIKVICESRDDCQSILEKIKKGHSDHRVTPIDSTSNELLELAGDRIASGRVLPLVNFCNGPLSFVDPWRPSLAYAYGWLAGLAFLALALIGGVHYRAGMYRNRTQEIVDLQESIYAELFPNQKIPAGLMSRFESEARKLRITKSTDQRPSIESIVPVSLAFWQAIPSQEHIRFQLQTVSMEGSSLKNLRGMIREFRDMDEFRSAIGAHGFSLPPVSTKSSPQGIALQWSSVPWSPVSISVATEGSSQ